MSGVVEALKYALSKNVLLDEILNLHNPNFFIIEPHKSISNLTNPLLHIPFKAWYLNTNDFSVYDEKKFEKEFKWKRTEFEKPTSTKLIRVESVKISDHKNEERKNDDAHNQEIDDETDDEETDDDEQESDSNDNSQPKICKIYETYGDPKIFRKTWREFLIITTTKLMEYKYFYYNKQTKQVYIIMNYYGDNLMTKLQQNRDKLFKDKDDDDDELKLLVKDVVNKLWILQKCGYIHGDIKPENIVKRQYNRGWQFKMDGKLLILIVRKMW